MTADRDPLSPVWRDDPYPCYRELRDHAPVVLSPSTSSYCDRAFSPESGPNVVPPPPVATPCERIVYRGGMLNMAFVALCGLTLVGVAVWMLWELWSAVEPKPITDDFLRLLNESFGLDWRNPLKWPWARLSWAYGFAVVGAVLTAGAGLTIWTLVVSATPSKALTPKIETSQSFTLGR